jgi:adenine deaminase
LNGTRKECKIKLLPFTNKIRAVKFSLTKEAAMKQQWTLRGNRVDPVQKKIQYAEITVADGKIKEINLLKDDIQPGVPFLLPGFIDSHVHIESSMLVPAEFARLAVVHGTIATISDPHEIANVCGIDGVYDQQRKTGTV